MFREKFSGKTDEVPKESGVLRENVAEITSAELKKLELNRRVIVKALALYPGITKDFILQLFRDDSRVFSISYKNGRFHLKTTEGNSSFKMVFSEKRN
jgi:hypothetical protein